jgi:16S rRNA (guanine966-N2)-methyltransferase
MHIIGGRFKKRVLVSPKTERVRPTTSQLREALFNICQLTIEGASFLDLFAGSGAMGLEALSRGAKQVTFVENNRDALAAIKKNIASLQVEEQCTVFSLDIFKALQRLDAQKQRFDLIYADPPYGEGLGTSILEFLDRHPLLATNGSLFIEESLLHPPPLQHLKLRGERKIGNTHLYEYM